MSQVAVKWWQRPLSYVMEIPLESRSSGFNPQLQVSLVRNRFQLSTQKSIYSFDDLYVNFFRAFEVIPLPKDGCSVLILGLGLASIPFMLERHFSRKYHYVAVEIDEEVIALANKYTLTRLESRVEVYCTDAAIFVETCQRQFDLVIVDLFLDDIIPSFLADVQGNKKVKSLISPGGIVLYNRLYRTRRDQEQTRHFHQNVFQRVFDNPDQLDVGGNWILVGSNAGQT